jgi:MFS family permease
MRRSTAGGLALLSLLILAFGLSRSVALSSVILIGVGGVYTMSVSATNSGLQTAVPPRKRGRVMSLYMMAWGGLFPIGGVAAGYIATHLGAPATLAILSIPLMLGAAALAFVGPDYLSSPAASPVG